VILAVVNVRHDSKRFPGKAMEPLLGDRTALDLFLERMKAVDLLDQIVVTVRDHESNRGIEMEALEADVPVLSHKQRLLPSGAENLLERTILAARHFHADAVVRVTADCPLLDPRIVQKCIWQYVMNRNGVNYVSNCWYGARADYAGFPPGMACEVLSRDVLEQLWYNWRSQRFWHRRHSSWVTDFDLQHVTSHIQRHPRQVGHLDVQPVMGTDPATHKPIREASGTRLTMDYPVDAPKLRAIYEALYPRNAEYAENNVTPAHFSLTEILAWLAENPEIDKSNQGVK